MEEVLSAGLGEVMGVGESRLTLPSTRPSMAEDILAIVILANLSGYVG